MRDFFYKYANFSLAIQPVLYTYFVPGTAIHIDTFMMIFNGCLFFVYNSLTNYKTLWPKYYPLFFIYASIIPLFGCLYFNNTRGLISSWTTLGVFSLYVLQILPLIQFNKLLKYLRIIVYLACIIFVLQEIMYAILGWRFSFLIPALPVAYTYTDTAAFIARQMVENRSMSFFLEPAHFAQYVSIYIAIKLGLKCSSGSVNLLEECIISVILIFTWSGNAILSLALVWSFYLIFIRLSIVFKWFIFLPLTIIAIAYSISLIADSQKGIELMKRQSELELRQSRVSSGMMRIYRGFYVFEDEPPLLKVTGAGTGYIENIIDDTSAVNMFYKFERYVNNVQTLLIGLGILGTSLFVLFLKNLVRCRNFVPLFLIVLFLALSFIESFWMGSKMALMICVAVFIRYKTNSIYDTYI